jgi:hypothetical protein
MIVDYREIFDPDHSHSNQYYSLYAYGRANSNVILSYDGLALLLQATCNSLGKECDIANYDEHKVSPDAIMRAVPQAFQGISGQISYSEASNAPQGKAVLILLIGKNGTQCIQMAGGRYQAGTQGQKASNAPCSSSNEQL